MLLSLFSSGTPLPLVVEGEEGEEEGEKEEEEEEEEEGGEGDIKNMTPNYVLQGKKLGLKSQYI